MPGLLLANILRVQAARMKMAAVRRIRRIGHFALQNNPFHLHLGIGYEIANNQWESVSQNAKYGSSSMGTKSAGGYLASTASSNSAPQPGPSGGAPYPSSITSGLVSTS